MDCREGKVAISRRLQSAVLIHLSQSVSHKVGVWAFTLITQP